MINYKSEIGTACNALQDALRQEDPDKILQCCDDICNLAGMWQDYREESRMPIIPQTNRDWNEEMLNKLYRERGIQV